MLTVYGLARSRVSRTLWMLEELAIPYRHISIGKGPDGIQSPAFLQINPHGRVPALVDGSLVVWESLAINLYLAKRYGGALGPQDADEDAKATMWTIWTAAEVEAAAHQIFVHTLRDQPEDRDPDRVVAAVSRLAPSLLALQLAIQGGGGSLVGGRFTVADLNVASVLFYLRGLSGAFAAVPRLGEWYALASGRSAFGRMLALRDADRPTAMPSPGPPDRPVTA